MCVEGEPCEAAQVAASSGSDDAGGEPMGGEEVYSSACAGCHSSGAMGAPRLGNAGDWAGRIDKGTDTLYSNAINGINAMPAKGGNASLSDDEVKAAVDHMLASVE